MKNQKLVSKKRLKRKRVVAKRRAHDRDRRYLSKLPKETVIRILQKRGEEARALKQAKRNDKKKKKVVVPNMHATNKPMQV